MKFLKVITTIFQAICLARSEKFMVIGGNEANNDVEVISINEGVGYVCPFKPSSFPIGRFSVGTFLEDHPLVCGGFPDANGFDSDICYTYDNLTDSWVTELDMNVARRLAAGAAYSSDEFWIIGGFQNGIGWMPTTEICSVSSKNCSNFVRTPEVPNYPQVLKLSEDSFVFFLRESTRGWTFNKSTESITPLPNMPENKLDPQVGLVRDEDGPKEVVVAGGYFSKTSVIFELRSGVWRMGPDLPVKRELFGGGVIQHNSVSFGDSFIIVGGFDYNASVSTLLAYDSIGEDWKILPFKLEKARNRFAYLTISDDLLPCANSNK